MDEITRLKHDRALLGLSQKQVAKKCHLEQCTLSRIENGILNIRYNDYVAVRRYLDEQIKRRVSKEGN